MIAFELNGASVEVEAPPDRRLTEILREDLSLTGTKLGCAIGRCGACTVLLDGGAAPACLLMAWQVEGRRVVTIEGLREDPRLAPLFEALAEASAFQCGSCAPGVTAALACALDAGAEGDDLVRALEGNLCRCTGYRSILAGARLAAERMGGA